MCQSIQFPGKLFPGHLSTILDVEGETIKREINNTSRIMIIRVFTRSLTRRKAVTAKSRAVQQQYYHQSIWKKKTSKILISWGERVQEAHYDGRMGHEARLHLCSYSLRVRSVCHVCKRSHGHTLPRTDGIKTTYDYIYNINRMGTIPLWRLCRNSTAKWESREGCSYI